MQNLISKTSAVVSNSLYVSLPAALFSEIISNLQLMHIILSTSSFAGSTTTDKPDVVEVIREITSASGAFSLFEYIDLPSLAYLALTFFSFYFLLLVLLIAITAVQAKQNSEAYSFISKTLSKLCLFHSRVLFFFFLYASFGLIHHNTSLCLLEHAISYNQCGTGWLVIAFVFSICSFGFAIIQEFLLYRINKNKNAYASKNNHLHQLRLLHKLMGLVSYFFFQNTLLRAQITSVIHIIFIICGMYIFFTQLPFYNTRVLKTVLFMNAANFSISVISIVHVFGQEINISRNYLLAAGLLMMIFHFSLLHKQFDRIREGRIDSPEKAIHFAILLKESNLGQLNLPLFEKKFCKAPIMAVGFLFEEGIDLSQAKSPKEYERSIYKFLIKKLSLTLERYPNSDVLMLYMADIYRKKLGNVLMAANLLEKIKRRDPSLSVRNSVRNMFIHLKHSCHEIYGNTDIKPELTNFFNYKVQAEFMRDNVEQEIAKHIQFWQELTSKNVSAIKILNLSTAIEKIESKIFAQYNEYKEASSVKFTPFLLVYAVYLQIIKELPSEAIKIFKTLQTLAIAQTTSHVFDVYSEKAGLIILSLNKGQIGTIVGASGSIENLFHVKKSKVIGTTLHYLLPRVIADKYTFLLEKCIKGSISCLENFRTYAKTKDGDYFEVDIKFQLYFHNIHGLSLLVIFKKISASKSIMIVDSKNVIQEYSKDVEDVLNLQESKHGSLHLQDLLADFGPSNALFGFMSRNCDSPSQGTVIHASQVNSSPVRKFSWFKSAIDNSRQGDETTIFSFSNVKSFNDENPLLNTLYNDFKPRRSRSKFLTVISTVPNESNTPSEMYRSDSLNSRDEECQRLSQWVKLKFYPLGQRDFPIDYNVQVKPFRFEEKVFKIIVLVSTDTDLFKLRENSPTLCMQPKQQVPDSFADDFPDDEERPETSCERRQKSWRLQKKFSLESPAKLPSSLHTKNLSTKLQNMLCGEKEKQQTTMILQRFDQTEDRSSNGFYHHRVIRTIKTLKSIFNGKRMHPLSKYSLLIIYLVMIFLIVLADLNFYWSRDSFNQIAYGLQVTDMASERLTITVDTWAMLLMIYSRATNVIPDPAIAFMFQQVVYNDTMHLIEKNNKLQSYLETTSKLEYIAKAFHRDVELWENLDSISTNSLIKGDSFTATNLLVNQYLNIAGSSNILETAKTDSYLCTVNNTANEYLLSSEQMISTTKESLSMTIDENESRLRLILYLTDLGLWVLFFMLIIAGWIIAQFYKRLFVTINKIPIQHIAQRIEQLQSIQPTLKIDIHTRDFANKQIQLINKNIEQNKSPHVKQINQNNKKEDSYWVKEIAKHLLKYVGPAILCLMLILGIFISSVIRTGGSFTVLQNVQERLSVSTDAMYHSNMLFASIYFFILLQNQTNFTVRNEPPANQITYSLDILKDINQRLIQTFSNQEKGFEDPLIESLFKNSVCNFITMPEQIADTCAKSTQGESIGLLALVSNYLDISQGYIGLYDANDTLDYARQLLIPYAAEMDIHHPVLQFTFKFLSSYILDELEIKVQAFRQQETVQLWIILVVILASTALIRTVAIRRLFILEAGRRRILKNIPFYMIQESRYMKSYLVREFKEEIAGIRDIL